MNLNKAIIVGRLTQDPELKSLPSGVNVTTFGMATNTYYTDKAGEKKDQVEFHTIVIFGKAAETCAKYLKKGQLALAEGRIQTRSWEKDDGTKGYKTQIVADRVQFGPAKTSPNAPESPQSADQTLDDQTSTGGVSAPAGKKQAGKSKGVNVKVEYPKEEINPDDIPF